MIFANVQSRIILSILIHFAPTQVICARKNPSKDLVDLPILTKILDFSESVDNEMFQELYEHDVNRFRGWFDARNMMYVKYDVYLDQKSLHIGRYVLERYGCDFQFKCGQHDSCREDLYVSGQLATPGLHHVKVTKGGFKSAMAYMFQFMGNSEPECGPKYQYYKYNVKACSTEHFKLWHQTDRMGCHRLECQGKNRSYNVLCIFESSEYSFPRNLPWVELYKPATSSQGSCSGCPEWAKKCVNNLCDSSIQHFTSLLLVFYLTVFHLSISWTN